MHANIHTYTYLHTSTLLRNLDCALALRSTIKSDKNKLFYKTTELIRISLETWAGQPVSLLSDHLALYKSDHASDIKNHFWSGYDSNPGMCLRSPVLVRHISPHKPTELSVIKLNTLIETSCLWWACILSYPCHFQDGIRLYITMTSKWPCWRLRSPASRLFTQMFPFDDVIMICVELCTWKVNI